MRFSTRIAILLMLLIGMGSVSAVAQFSSGIEGTVQDQSGAILSNAKVTLVDTKLGVARTVNSNQSGYFRLLGPH
jgi:hypothetical protein